MDNRPTDEYGYFSNFYESEKNEISEIMKDYAQKYHNREVKKLVVIMKSSENSAELILIEKFKNMMISELQKNNHKGSILNFKDFSNIITEMEYHKAKLFLAIRVKNKGAIREYLADTANYLLAIGNLFEVYNEEINYNECYEINKNVDLFVKVDVSEQSIGQKLIK